MSGINPLSSGASTRLTTAASPTKAAPITEQTGYAARLGQLGPTIGTVVATGEALSDAASATYKIASQKLNQAGHAAETAFDKAAQAVDDLEEAVGTAWTETQHTVSNAVSATAEGVEAAAKTVADAFDSGVKKLGQWVDSVV